MPTKALFTGYLLAIGLGLLFAGAQILMTHGMADGKFGLSVDEISYSYHGNHDGPNATKLNPNFVWLVIIGGFGCSLASTIMIFTSLYQMWIMPMRTVKPRVEE